MRTLTVLISAILLCTTALSAAAKKGKENDKAYGIGDTPKTAGKAKPGKADKIARPEGGGEWKNKAPKSAQKN